MKCFTADSNSWLFYGMQYTEGRSTPENSKSCLTLMISKSHKAQVTAKTQIEIRSAAIQTEPTETESPPAVSAFITFSVTAHQESSTATFSFSGSVPEKAKLNPHSVKKKKKK